MSEDLLQVPPIRFPVLGNSGVVGLFSMLHIGMAGISVGFILLAPLLEYLGIKDPFYTRLAKTLVQFIAVIFSVSATFAVIMVELFIGLFPVTTVYLFNRFETAIYAAIVLFLLHIFFFYTYWYRWEKMRNRSIRRHIVWGSIAALLVLAWGGLLDGLGSYMLTPPAPITENGGALLSLRRLPANATWIPLMIHRMIGNLIVSFYAIGLYGGWRLLHGGRESPREYEENRRYYNRVMKTGVVMGTAFLLIQPIAGILYSNQIGRANPQAIDRILHGPNRWLLILQFIFIGLLFIFCNFFLSDFTQDKKKSRIFNILILSAALAMMFTAQQVAIRRTITLGLILGTLFHLIFVLPGIKMVRPLEENRPASWLAISLGVCAMLTFLTMGIIREQIRRPYTVYGQIHLLDEKRSQTEWVKK